MTPDQLRAMGEQIARDIAAGIMSGVAAGASEVARTMQAVQRDAQASQQNAEADHLTALADRLEAERAAIRSQIDQASGLKRVALQRRLQQLDQAESTLIEQITGEQAPAALPTAPTADEVIPVSRHRNGRFRPVNGSHQ